MIYISLVISTDLKSTVSYLDSCFVPATGLLRWLYVDMVNTPSSDTSVNMFGINSNHVTESRPAEGSNPPRHTVQLKPLLVARGWCTPLHQACVLGVIL